MSGQTVPSGPVESPPRGFVPTPEQLAVLRDVLDGVPLGVWDERILEWLAGWPWSVVGTVASLITRARQAGEQS